MTGPSVHDTFDQFHESIGHAHASPPNPNTLRENGVLAVGVLLGGGLPATAASVAFLLECQFPETTEWPWTGSGEE